MTDKYCFVVPQNLEAATCILLFKWLSQKDNIEILVSNENSLSSDLNNIDFNNYKFVYIVGFYDLTKIPSTTNDKKFIFINKKITSKPSYENCRFIDGESTTIELFYKFLAKFTGDKLNGNQHIFYNSVVKYFHYNFDDDLLPLKLFYFFKTLPFNNKVEAFVKRFNSGLIMFSDTENFKLNIILKEISKTLKEIKIYSGNIDYNNKKYSIAACFGAKFINEISHRLQKTTNKNITIVINLEKNTVHYRRDKNIDLDLGELVNKCFQGYGTEYAAFSKLNQQLLELTKTFILNEHQTV